MTWQLTWRLSLINFSFAFTNVRMMRTLPRERGRYHTAPSLSLGTSRPHRERLVSCSNLEYRIRYFVTRYPYQLEVGPCGGPREYFLDTLSWPVLLASSSWAATFRQPLLNHGTISVLSTPLSSQAFASAHSN